MNIDRKRGFLDICLAGEAEPEQIEDDFEAWCNASDDRSEQAVLGLTQHQY